jgi:hypothetical protein
MAENDLPEAILEGILLSEKFLQRKCLGHAMAPTAGVWRGIWMSNAR